MLRRTSPPKSFIAGIASSLLLCGLLPACANAAVPAFSQFIVFGDSLSDTGNDANVTKGEYDITFPGEDFNYTTGRFTNGSDTNPPSDVYSGVWHEQLAKLFFGLPAATNSLNGGMDFAYGGATTGDGTSNLTSSNEIAQDLDVSIDVDNMGRQVTDYLSNNTPDPQALYIVWGGANDLFDNPSSSNAVAAADRETALVKRLADAGATTFLVPNIPPLGETPDYEKHDSKVMTEYATDFCNELAMDLDNLEASFGPAGLTVKIYRLNVFNLFEHLLQNQYAYGFTNIKDSAQGNSVKADQYLFWDGVHPTVAGHYQLAATAYSVLTGIPVIEINALPAGMPNTRDALSIFYLTRTGTDLSTTFPVPYTVGGTASEGTDYKALPGSHELVPSQRTAVIAVKQGTAAPAKPAKTISITLQPGQGYQLPVLPTATVKLLAQPSGD